MGTDIHFIAQRKDVDGKWHDLTADRNDYPNWNHEKKHYPQIGGEFRWTGSRNYFLFAWLADVRNGYGFAGVKIFEPVVPLTSNRGLPEGIEEAKYNDDGELLSGVYLGDHSFGWASFAEILAHPRRQVINHGVVPLAHYKETVAAGKPPTDCCGSIDGPGIITIDSSAIGDLEDAGNGQLRFNRRLFDADKVHVQASWIAERDGLDNFITAVREMAEKYGSENCRLVFGFDS